MRWERGTVAERLDGWAGVVRLSVDVGSERLRAIAYPELTGAPEPGEEVLLNTNALRRGLGTGGDALVVARPDAVGAGGVASGDGSADRDVVRGEDVVGGDVRGHMMKVRYTPVQVMVDALDDPGSPHHAALRDADSIEGMPVVAADLHSALPAIVAGILATRPTARIAYVLTDGAALPAAYSRTVATLREAGLLAACISAGQAFGGDHEAVSVPSALLGARHVVVADVAIAIQGPGNLGSGTAWGFSGVQAADALNAAGALGGRPVGALRVSGADPRPRHRGLSHHSSTTYGRLLHVPTTFALPQAAEDSAFELSVAEQLETSVVGTARRRGVAHEVHAIATDGLHVALRDLPVTLSTMGRGLDEDPATFCHAALAGRAAARLIPGAESPGA